MTYLSKTRDLDTDQINNISTLLIKGYTIRQIAKKYNTSVSRIVKYFETHYKGNTYPLFLNGKHEPYFENEDDYGKIPKYNFNSLSEDEKKIYKEI